MSTFFHVAAVATPVAVHTYMASASKTISPSVPAVAADDGGEATKAQRKLPTAPPVIEIVGVSISEVAVRVPEETDPDTVKRLPL